MNRKTLRVIVVSAIVAGLLVGGYLLFRSLTADPAVKEAKKVMQLLVDKKDSESYARTSKTLKDSVTQDAWSDFRKSIDYQLALEPRFDKSVKESDSYKRIYFLTVAEQDPRYDFRLDTEKQEDGSWVVVYIQSKPINNNNKGADEN
ncbi:hypothetical protein KC878_01320 [Candidatus Saccharibacteria bacterium]|nr:hypothetical protein [Candidatus Saccharibacteria bacterium]MCB9821125.1 hypothetical protein [Candidatus Nomurabacteria bacterium]